MQESSIHPFRIPFHFMHSSSHPCIHHSSIIHMWNFHLLLPRPRDFLNCSIYVELGGFCCVHIYMYSDPHLSAWMQKKPWKAKNNDRGHFLCVAFLFAALSGECELVEFGCLSVRSWSTVYSKLISRWRPILFLSRWRPIFPKSIRADFFPRSMVAEFVIKSIRAEFFLSRLWLIFPKSIAADFFPKSILSQLSFHLLVARAAVPLGSFALYIYIYIYIIAACLHPLFFIPSFNYSTHEIDFVLLNPWPINQSIYVVDSVFE